MHLSSELLKRLVAGLSLAAVTLAATPAWSVPQPLVAAAEPASDETVQAARAASQLTPVAPPQQQARTTIPGDRYAMANGCYTLRLGGKAITRTAAPVLGNPAKAEPIHFQATRLGEYLLFGTDKDFLSASEGEIGKVTDQAKDTGPGAAVGGITYGKTGKVTNEVAHSQLGRASGRVSKVVWASAPSRLSDWEVRKASAGTFTFTLPHEGVGLGVTDGALALVPEAQAKAFALRTTGGCATWPEVKVNISGPVPTGATPYDEVRGYIDAHLHGMAYEFLGGRARCGRPWSPYGVTVALDGCKEHEIAGGRAAVLENFLSGRDPAAGHDTHSGWPTFKDWPKPWSLTYEQTYYKWMERAWRGGMRMYTNLLVDNNELCKLYPYRRNSCNEMDGVRLQAKRLHQFVDYIDAQHGGPGKGWLEIVTDPFEARRVMNAGKLAVVMGIEISVLFDCGTVRGIAKCDEAHIDRQLDEVYDMGVRQMELVNKFDNALSGVTGDNDEVGVLVNGANFADTGSFWRMKTCPEDVGEAHDHGQYNFHDTSGAPEEFSGRDSLVGMLLSEAGGTGAAPVYGPGPHCNQLGLSSLGEHLITRMMDRGMIFDPDHMSAIARDQALDLIESRGYSGVVSSHSWADDTIYPRIMKVGGVVTPHTQSSTGFVEKALKHRTWRDDRYYYGIGFGSDMNGFSAQGNPRGADVENPVEYPFTGFGGVTVHKQRSGEKSFDINTDGVAHWGMYPDWVEDVRKLGGDEIVRQMERAPESFVQMWERAVGVPPDTCRDDVADLSDSAVRSLERGMTPEEAVLVTGQPASRDGSTMTVCTASGPLTMLFGETGRLTDFKILAETDPELPDDRQTDVAKSTNDGLPGAASGAAGAAAGGAKDGAAESGKTLAGGTAESGSKEAATQLLTSRERTAATGAMVLVLLAAFVLIRRRRHT